MKSVFGFNFKKLEKSIFQNIIHKFLMELSEIFFKKVLKNHIKNDAKEVNKTEKPFSLKAVRKLHIA